MKTSISPLLKSIKTLFLNISIFILFISLFGFHDVNILNAGFSEELLHTVEWGSVEKLETILKNKSNFNDEDRNALNAALLFAGCDMARGSLLLSYGANLNAQDETGKTVLMECPKSCHHDWCIKYIEFLISKGADINIRDKNGDTALMYASFNGCGQFIKLLLSQGADGNSKNQTGQTALMLATGGKGRLAGNFSASAVENLLAAKNINLNEKDKYGNSALAYATIFRVLKSAETLLAHGADVNTKNRWGQTPLMQAVGQTSIGFSNIAHEDNEMKKTIEALTLALIDKGAEINVADHDRWTSLMMAVANDRAEIAAVLLSKGAEVNAKNKRGETPLILAAERGNIPILRNLLAKGADVHVKETLYGNTAMLAATRGEHLDVLKELVERGGNINERDKNGETALMLVIQRARQNPDRRDRYMDIIKFLVARGIDLNAKNNNRSALSLAKETGDAEIEVLLKQNRAKE